VADALLRALGFAFTTAGMAWLALAIAAHWAQVRGAELLTAKRARVLRVLGGFSLFGALALALRADHLSMAPLVWVMTLAASALLIAFTLAYRPRLLAGLVAWMPRSRASNDER
jgi:hypothetical protein